MSAALITATFVGIAALGYATVLGFTAFAPAEVFRHTSLGIFATLVTLLAHSMTMFYLIGKGKAVREAVQEGQLSVELYRAVARVRRPVFSIATLAMVVTMATAIVGGGVDTDTVPVVGPLGSRAGGSRRESRRPAHRDHRHAVERAHRCRGRPAARGSLVDTPAGRPARLILFDIDGTLLLSAAAREARR